MHRSRAPGDTVLNSVGRLLAANTEAPHVGRPHAAHRPGQEGPRVHTQGPGRAIAQPEGLRGHAAGDVLLSQGHDERLHEEACAFEDLGKKFAKAGAAVVGVSILPPKSKKKFAEKEGLSYPLLADDRVNDEGKPDPAVCAKYGVWVEKSMYGKTYMGIQRTTYLIGADGKVVQRWDKVKVPGHAEEVLEAVKGL